MVEVAAVAVAALTTLYLAFTARATQLSRRIEHGLQSRHDERERLAREIHDTFLQSVQGLILQVHATTQLLPAGHVRERLERALDLGEQTLAEGRMRVYQLRNVARVRTDLLHELLLAATDHAVSDPPLVHARVSGVARRLCPVVQDELYAAGREAVWNALRHAMAHSIRIRFTYGWRGITIEVDDDGVGIAREVLAAGGRPGHWGLTGMNERMARIGGTFGLSSEPGKGTHVRLWVPARDAFQSRLSIDWGVVWSNGWRR